MSLAVDRFSNTDAYSTKESPLENLRELDQFLASIERRAFCIALQAVGSREDALDIVQDAMLKLVQKYARKPAADWPGLFHAILQSRIRDWYRRSKVRSRWRVWLDKLSGAEEDQHNPIERFSDPNQLQSEQLVDQDQSMEKLDQALAQLPQRQQQAFFLRAWEGLSVRDTANAMGCSEGSVKTHYSRAVHGLRLALEEFAID